MVFEQENSAGLLLYSLTIDKTTHTRPPPHLHLLLPSRLWGVSSP